MWLKRRGMDAFVASSSASRRSAVIAITNTPAARDSDPRLALAQFIAATGLRGSRRPLRAQA